MLTSRSRKLPSYRNIDCSSVISHTVDAPWAYNFPLRAPYLAPVDLIVLVLSEICWIPPAPTRHAESNVELISNVIQSCLAHQLYCLSYFLLHTSLLPLFQRHMLESKKRFFVLFL